MVFELYNRLREKEIYLKIINSKIKIDAPKGVLTKDIIDEIRNNKSKLINLLLRMENQKKFKYIKKADKKDFYIASSAQKRMYLLQEINKDSTVYNMPLSIGIDNDIPIEQVAEIFLKLINKHESLRTNFRMIDGILNQKINEFPKFKIEKYNDSEIKDFIRPFDLQNELLIRVGIVEGEKQRTLLVDTHHIIADGVSCDILRDEFISLLSNNQLPDNKFQYKDYSEWQNSEEQQNKIKEQEKFWLDEFSDELPIIDLPYDFARPSMQNFEGASISFMFNKERSDFVKDICKEQGITLFSFMFTCYSILLSKLSNQSEIIIGTVSSGRNHVDMNNIIGMFVNTLAIKTEFSNNIVFKEFLDISHRKITRVFDNQDYQFDDLVDKVCNQRDKSRNPIFDTLITLDNHERNNQSHGEYSDEFMHYANEDAKFDLILHISESEKYITCNYNYCTKLFKSETIYRFVNYFKKIITNITLETKLSDIEMITAEEKHQLLYDFNDTSTDYPRDKTIHQLFEEQVDITHDHLALVFEDNVMTYRELNSRSNQLARLLREKGVKPDTIVGIMVDRSFEMIIGILGILKSSGAYLPIDTEYPEKRINYMLKDAEVKVLLTQNQYVDESKEKYDLKVIDLDLESTYENDDSNLELVNTSTYLAYVIYTSGTTGKPKGVMIEHRSVVNIINWFIKEYNILDKTRLLQLTNYTFDPSVEDFFSTLCTGGNVHIVRKNNLLDIEWCRNYILDNRITMLNYTPDFLKELLLGKSKLNSIKTIISGGAELENNLKENIIELGYELSNNYGPTESTVDSISMICEKGIKVSLGNPVDNTQIYIMYNNKLQPIGVSGELYISGSGLARGYLNNPALTDEKFIDNPSNPKTKMYKTGDLARWLPDGNIVFLGRIDDQVKIRGFRIELGEIENQLLSYSGIKESIVIDRTDENEEKYLCAYYVKNEYELDIETLKSFIGKSLPDYMIPSYFVELDRIPLTSNGKVDRKALPVPEIVAGADYLAPRNEIEEKLVDIWSEVLNIEKENISVNANFFEIGGNSLKIMTLVSLIHKNLDVKIAISEVFISSTIQALSGLIVERKPNKFISIKKALVKNSYLLSPAQKRMYLLQQMDIESTAYNMPQYLPIKDISLELIQEAVDSLLARHESFRTEFVFVNDEPKQKILPEVDFLIQGYSVADFSELLSLYEKFVKPFDLSKAPLLRIAYVLNKENQQSYLFTDMHHIISDDVSIKLLQKDFTKLLAKESLEPLELQYKDYSEWQNSKKNRKEIVKQKEYWLNEFSDEIPILNLPYDYPRPLHLSYEGATLSFILEEDLTDKIRSFSKQSNSTLYMTLLSLFNILLSKLSNSEDIVIGAPVAGREHSDLSKIIGMFVNTLALRNYPNSELTFKKFLENVKNRASMAFDNQLYQFEDLVDNLNVERDLGRNPLFDVCFNLLDTVEKMSFDKQKNELEHYNGTAIFDLFIYVLDDDKDIHLSFNYRSKLFRPETIDRFVKYFKKILTDISLNTKLIDIDILSDIEKHQLLYDFNDTHTDYPKDKTIQQLFEEQVKKTPDNVALEFENIEMSYLELNKKANKLARLLRSKGVVSDTVVGIIVDRSFEIIIGIMGILKSGGAYLPIDPLHPEERNNNILNSSGVKILIVKGGKYVSSKFENIGYIDLEENNYENNSKENLNYISTYESLAYVIYTSGSTGEPKGVMINHNNVTNFITGVNCHISFDEELSLLSLTTISFDIFGLEMFLPLVYGGKVVIGNEFDQNDPERILSMIKSKDIDILQVTPSRLHMLLSSELKTLESLKKLKYLLVGGEALSPNLLNSIQQVTNSKICNLYGPTETTIWSTIKDVTNDSFVSIGKPISNTQIYILDRYNNIQPIGVSGELCISGLGLALGYQGNDRLTNEKFVENPFNLGTKLYKTGDRARWLPDGNIECFGRLDYQVKIRGFRIELGEIENELLKHSDICEAVVIDRVEKERDKYLYAYFVSKNKDNYEVGIDTDDYIDNWSNIWSQAYADKSPNFKFDTSGWIDSYTRENISSKEMKHWVEYSIDNILSLTPKNIYEIGCGTGLLLYKLHNNCGKYYGIDISDKAIIALKNHLVANNISNVEVEKNSAHNFDLVSKRKVDTIVLNSVIQYFPNIEYFNEVIKKSVSEISDIGNIYIGDVRNFKLIEHFHSKVHMELNTINSKLTDIRDYTKKTVELEKELLISPEYFYTLPSFIPHISNVEVKLKKGYDYNEMTEFRYDVVLTICKQDKFKKQLNELIFQKMNFAVNKYNNYELENKIHNMKNDQVLQIINIPNARLSKTYSIFDLEKNINLNSKINVNNLIDRHEKNGVEPQLLYDLCKSNNKRCILYYSDNSKLMNIIVSNQVINYKYYVGNVSMLPSQLYFNNPYQNSNKKLISNTLKQMLLKTLPYYMVPSYFVQLDKLPLTPNGKVDRKALPTPEIVVDKNYVTPRNETEEKLVEIWSEVLNHEITKISVNANFFELGGHSLKATILVSKIHKEFDVKIPLSEVFKSSTISELSDFILNAAKSKYCSIEPVSIKEYYNLSSAQKRMYFLQQMSIDSTAYNMPQYFPIGDIALEEIKSAVDLLIAHYESFRTSFVLFEDVPKQKILPDVPLMIEEHEVSDLSKLESLYERFIKPFNLSQAPLLRIGYVRNLKNKESYLLTDMHHIISDGVSMNLLQEDFKKLLSKESLEPLKLQYRDYSEWQNSEEHRAEIKQQEEYWLNEFEDEIPVLKLPYDYTRPVKESNIGGHVTILLDKIHTKILRNINKELTTTYNMTLLSVFSILLYKLSNQKEIIIGSSLTGRNITDLENIIGMFVNSLPIRTFPNNFKSYKTLLLEIKEATLGMYENQDYQFENLVNKLNIKRIIGRNPIFDVMINMLNMEEVGEIDINEEIAMIEKSTKRFDLTLNVTVYKEVISIDFQYDSNLFKSDTILKYVTYFKNIINSIGNDIDKKINEIEILRDEDIKNMLRF